MEAQRRMHRHPPTDRLFFRHVFVSLVLGGALALSACVNVVPLQVPEHHPGSVKAPSGLVAAPTALEDYKTASDFAARAIEDAKAPQSHAQHGNGGTQHGSAPQGAPSR